jgi:Variant SH3 domain
LSKIGSFFSFLFFPNPPSQNPPQSLVTKKNTTSNSTFHSVEGSEGELALCAGDYLLVWGNGEPQGGYYDAELLDGRRGLVPASFVQRLIGNDVHANNTF